MREWLRLALEPSVVRRALRTMAVVAPILIAINQGDALVRGELGAVRALKIALTLLVPYAVSTASSVSTLRSRSPD